MASEHSDGSQTCTLNTEHTLATITDAGTYALGLDVGTMANDDILQIRIYTKTRSSTSSQKTYTVTLANVQINKSYQSIPIISPHEWKATIEQIDGTGRTLGWSVYEL